MRRRNCPRAFTLIELLVVIAILTLLVAMLTPALARAKDLARRLQCQTSLKIIGTGVHMFAGNHGGRGPSHAGLAGSTNTVGWYGLLYSERCIPKPVCTMATPYPAQNTIHCPSVQNDRYWVGYRRAFLANSQMEADHDHPHSNPDGSPYGNQNKARGAWVRPPPPGYRWYVLGPAPSDFPKPSYQFMMWESHYGGDYAGYRWGEPAHITLDFAGSSAPPWASASYGWMAFRHVLPRDTRQYQTQATASFLFIDSHVEILNAMAQINRPDRFNFKP